MSSSPRSNCSIPVLSLIGLLIALVSNSLALDPAEPLGEFRLVRWDEDQGLPQNLTPRIAQTSDGFLWLGFNHGLIRFDGKNFAVDNEIHANIKLPLDVFALLPTSSGELWIASEGALYSRFANGEFKRFDTADGLPNDFFNCLFCDTEGTIWIGTENHGLFQRKQNQFKSYPGSVDLSRKGIFCLCETPAGVLWVGTAFGIYRVEKTSGQVNGFTKGEGLPGEQVYSLTVDREGRVWAGTERGLARMGTDGRFQPFGDRIGDRPIQTLMTDSHGMIWVSASGGGLWRIKPETGDISELPPENGNPVPDIRSVYEDREGNVWLATSIGLERLSDVKFTTYTTRDGLPSDDVLAVTAGAGGQIWVGTNNGLARLDQGKIETLSWGPYGKVAPGVTALYEDSRGVLWFGLRDATLHRLEGGVQQQIASLRTASGPGYATGICLDQKGNLWVGTNGAGLHLFQKGELVKSFTGLEDGLRDRAIFSLWMDRDQTLWIGETLGADVLRDMTIKPAPGENVQTLRSTVFSFYADPDGTLWVGTFNGLCRYKNGRWAPVVYRPSERGVGPEFYCLLEDDHGNLWSNGPHGVFLVPKRELDDFFDGKRSPVSCQAFGKADGLKSPQHGNADGYFQAGCRSPDGRFWFATSSGLAVIDPNNLQLNPLPPPVQIEQVVVDLTQVFPFRPADPRVELGPGTHSLEFDYAGLSFSAPEKVRFKYQLKGFDKDWVDAGARREAYYTNLPPGRYQFRVIACNNDGLWIPEQAAATTTLIVQPHFYQTIWFYLLCAGAVIGAVPVLWRWRLQQILEERTRLSRELHDTVARGVVALIWQIEGAKSAAQKGRFDLLFPSLDAAAKMARESLRETRQAMRALRSGVLDTGRCFATALEAVLTRTAEGTHLRPQLQVRGAPYRIDPAWEQALVRITQESLTNTLKYAKASQFEVELRYSPRETRLRLHDDGIGFDYQPGGGSAGNTTVARASGVSGGLGLLGIEERCRQLGGRVQIASSSTEGTTLEIIVPRRGLFWGWLTFLWPLR